MDGNERDVLLLLLGAGLSYIGQLLTQVIRQRMSNEQDRKNRQRANEDKDQEAKNNQDKQFGDSLKPESPENQAFLSLNEFFSDRFRNLSGFDDIDADFDD